MSTVWEGKHMHNTITIIRYEYKMQMTRIATWGLLTAAAVLSLLDNFPSAGNLHRLEFLADPVYFIYRVMSQDGLTVAFGLMILLSNRFSVDAKTGVKHLVMAGPTAKAEYIFGKTLGSFCCTVTVFALFLTADAIIYCLAAPFPVAAGILFETLVKTIFICVLPVSFFVCFLSAGLPALLDVRFFYAMAAVLFILNTAAVSSAEAMPFYCITSGDLARLIWHHPKWTFINTGSIQANLIFLAGSGLLSLLLLFAKKSFWRHEA